MMEYPVYFDQLIKSSFLKVSILRGELYLIYTQIVRPRSSYKVNYWKAYIWLEFWKVKIQ